MLSKPVKHFLWIINIREKTFRLQTKTKGSLLILKSFYFFIWHSNTSIEAFDKTNFFFFCKKVVGSKLVLCKRKNAHEWGNFFFSPFFILHASIPLITFVSRGHKSYNRHTQDIRRNERERKRGRKELEVEREREREREKEREG